MRHCLHPQMVLKLLQILTDKEACNVFKEDCTAEMKAVMKDKCDSMRKKYTADTDYNRKVNDRLNRMEEYFPEKTWFLGKKPPQTKVNYEHTTGLCMDCHASQINHETLLWHARAMCQCGTDNCENWICICEDSESCSCEPVCHCDSCKSCQVNTKNTT